MHACMHGRLKQGTRVNKINNKKAFGMILCDGITIWEGFPDGPSTYCMLRE